MNIRQRRNPLQKALKDYMVPIIGGILILILLFSLFSGGSDSAEEKVTNEIPYIILFDGSNTEAYIEKLSGQKDKIENGAELYKGEKIMVKKGSIEILVDDVANFKLSSSGILEYKKDSGFYLSSGNLWVESISNFSIDTIFGKIRLVDSGVVNISQYGTSLSLYDFTGKSEIINNAGASTVLSKGEEIEIGTIVASDENIDLSLLKTEIKDTFKASPWYIKNGGDDLLSATNEEETSTGSKFISKGNNLSKYISFDKLSDEIYISESSIDISGTYDSKNVGKIVINGNEMELDIEKSSFSYSSFPTSSSENDLVIKIYDLDESLLDKYLITVYNSNISSNSTSSVSGGFKVTTFDIDASKIKFTSPSTGSTYITTGDEITIKGVVPANTFASVSVNDYKLKSFNGTSWKYHAFTRFDNLKIGTNQYKINYFDDNGKVIYTNYYTIVKKDPKSVEPKVPSTYSKEASIN